MKYPKNRGCGVTTGMVEEGWLLERLLKGFIWGLGPLPLLDFESANKTIHPTQKPVALMEYLIKTDTNECETALDFTAGSFTTSVAYVIGCAG